MIQDSFFKDNRLPFVEARSSLCSEGHFKLHMHKGFSIGAVSEGEALYRVADHEVKLKPGVLALINPETLHACNAATGARSFSMLYLDVQWCLGLQQSLWGNDTYLPVDCITINDALFFTFYLQVMESLFSRNDLLLREQYLLRLAVTTFARCCPPTVPLDSPPQYVELLKNYLADNPGEDLTLDQFAAKHRVNSFTMHRHFVRATGITPHAYRLNCRIEHARELLGRGMDAGDVAQRCGFFDQSHFHKTFKAMTAVTPGQYQRSIIDR